MTRPAECVYPGDLSLSDRVDVIRFDGRALFINGYKSSVSAFHHIVIVPNMSPTASAADNLAALQAAHDALPAFLAHDILNVVQDPVPGALVAAFAAEVIDPLLKTNADGFVLMSCAVEAWIRRRGQA